MSKKTETKSTGTGIVLGKVKQVESKYPAFVKWIVGVIAAIIMAAIGFFGSIFGLNESQQDKIKQMIIGSSVYQESVETTPVVESVEEVKK